MVFDDSPSLLKCQSLAHGHGTHVRGAALVLEVVCKGRPGFSLFKCHSLAHGRGAHVGVAALVWEVVCKGRLKAFCFIVFDFGLFEFFSFKLAWLTDHFDILSMSHCFPLSLWGNPHRQANDIVMLVGD